MGVLADQIRATIEAMKEEDKKREADIQATLARIDRLIGDLKRIDD